MMGCYYILSLCNGLPQCVCPCGILIQKKEDVPLKRKRLVTRSDLSSYLSPISQTYTPHVNSDDG